MRRAAFIVFVLVLWLSTCKAPEPNMPLLEIAPSETIIPATETAIPPTPTETAVPQAKLPAPPFSARLYVSKTGGFALDYPEGWTVKETVVGDRGTEILFVSKSDLAEAATLPLGETRLTATIYQWDPKNNLPAYVDHWKTAWESSGFTILEEQALTLELGLSAEQFLVQTPEAQVIYLIAALNDQYLVLAGEGDLELVRQIVQRVRPIS
jgi:hypothetical protein